MVFGEALCSSAHPSERMAITEENASGRRGYGPNRFLAMTVGHTSQQLSRAFGGTCQVCGSLHFEV
jgi:hypothetical protein